MSVNYQTNTDEWIEASKFEPRHTGMKRQGRVSVGGFRVNFGAYGNKHRQCVWQWPSHLTSLIPLLSTQFLQMTELGHKEFNVPRSHGKENPVGAEIRIRTRVLHQPHPLNQLLWALPFQRRGPVPMLRWMCRGPHSSMGKREKWGQRSEFFIKLNRFHLKYSFIFHAIMPVLL